MSNKNAFADESQTTFNMPIAQVPLLNMCERDNSVYVAHTRIAICVSTCDMCEHACMPSLTRV